MASGIDRLKKLLGETEEEEEEEKERKQTQSATTSKTTSSTTSGRERLNRLLETADNTPANRQSQEAAYELREIGRTTYGGKDYNLPAGTQSEYQKRLNAYSTSAPMSIAKASEQALDTAKSRDSQWWQEQKNQSSADATKLIAKGYQSILEEKKEPEPKDYTVPAPVTSHALTPELEAERIRRNSAQGENVAPGAWTQNQMAQTAEREKQAEQKRNAMPSGWKYAADTASGAADVFQATSGQILGAIDKADYWIMKNLGIGTFGGLDINSEEANAAAHAIDQDIQNAIADAKQGKGPWANRIIDAFAAAGNIFGSSMAGFGLGGMGTLSATVAPYASQMASASAPVGASLTSKLAALGTRFAGNVVGDLATSGTNAIISAQSAISTYDTARNYGADHRTAATAGFAAFMAEYISNKMFSGTPLEDSPEQKGYVIELIEDIAEKMGKKGGFGAKMEKALTSFFGNTVVSHVFDKSGEGLEEVITGVIDPFVAKLTYNKDEDLATFSDLLEEYIGGVLMSVVMGIPGAATNTAKAAVSAVGLQGDVYTPGWQGNTYNAITARLSQNPDYAQKSKGNEKTAEQAKESNSDSLKRYSDIYNRRDAIIGLLQGADPADMDAAAFVNDLEAGNYFYIWETQGARAADAYYEQNVQAAANNRKAQTVENVRQMQMEAAQRQAEEDAREAAYQAARAQAEAQAEEERRTTPPLTSQENAQDQQSRRLTEADLDEYLRTGVREHVRNAKAYITKRGESPILTKPAEIAAFIRDSVLGKIRDTIKGYGRVNNRLTDAVNQATNGRVNIRDYYLELDSNMLAHLSDHINTDKDSRNLPLTEEQTQHLPEYIDNYDDLIDILQRKDGSVRLILGKKINGHAVIIEAVSKGRNALHPVTAYQIETEKYNRDYKTKAIDRSSTSQPETSGQVDISRPAIASEDRVPQQSETVNNNNQGKLRIRTQEQNNKQEEAPRLRIPDNRTEVNNGRQTQSATPAERAEEARAELYHGDEGRGAGQRAGEQAVRMDAGAEDRQQNPGQPQTARNRRNYARTQGTEQVDTQERLGITGATKGSKTTVITERAVQQDAELKTISGVLSQATGLPVTFTIGSIQLDNAPQGARGVYTGSRFIVQADHNDLTATQIALHELYHYFAEQDPTLNDRLRESILEAHKGEALEAMVARYVDAIGETVGMTEDMDERTFRQAVDKIKEEIYANAYAGINAYGGDTGQFAQETRAAVKDTQRNLENAAATDRTTGPPQQIKNDIGASDEELAAEGNERYSIEEDPDTLRRLNGQPTVTVYRAMQVIDGKLYPPMAAKVSENGGKRQLVEPTEFDTWYRSDEHPELIDANGKFVLDKGNGSSLKAAYNPYFHTSNMMLNDQFSSAWNRDNLVVVEASIPESELTSGYKAEGAKDAVGEMNWHSGPVASKLKGDKARRVTLSRWVKINRIVPNAEVAQSIAKLLDGENISIPENTVTPSLRAELQKLGVPISKSRGIPESKYSVNEPEKKLRLPKISDSTKENRGQTQDVAIADTGINESYSINEPTDTDYLAAVDRGDMETAQRMVDEAAKAAGFPIKAYHGTRSFGFTVFDTSKTDDGISLFATSSPVTAETYSGKTTRNRIKDRSTINADDLHGEELIEEARKYNKRYNDYKLMSDKDKATVREDAKSSIGWSIRRAQEFVRDHNGAFDSDKSAIMDRLISALYHLRDSETENDISEAWNEWEDAVWDLKGMDDSIALEFLDDVDSRGIFQSKNELDDMTYQGDMYADWYAGGPDYIFDNQLQIELNAELNKGIYELYGKPGKQLVVEAGGANWNQITPPKELQDFGLTGPQRTRDIASAAKALKYDSVLFKNLRDNGGETPYNGESDVYIFFDPHQLKSADPVTYGDNGNVIPLSERFNSKKEDIRYSINEPQSSAEYDQMKRQRWVKDKAQRELTKAQKQQLADLQAEIDRRSDESYQRKIFNEQGADALAKEVSAVKRLQRQAEKIRNPQEKKPVAKSQATIARKDLAKTLMSQFSIPAGRKAEAQKVIEAEAEKIIKNGRIDIRDQINLFNYLYNEGEMTVEPDEAYKYARDLVRGGRVYVPEKIKHEFGDGWGDFRRRAFAAGILLTNNESDMSWDQWNSSLNADFPSLFPEDEYDPRSVLEQMVRVSEEGKDQKMSLPEYAASVAGQEYASEDEMMDNLDRQLDWTLRTFAEKAGLEIYLKDRTGIKIAEEREKAGQALDRQRAQEIVRRAKEREQRKEAARRQAMNRELREMQQRTLKQLRWLSQNRFKFSGDMQAEVDNLLQDIDIYAASAANEMHLDSKTGKTWKDLRDLYTEAKANDPNFLPSKELERIVARLDYKKIGDLDIGALTDLYKAAVGLRTELYNRNNVINDELHQTFAEVYDAAKGEINGAEGGYQTGAKGAKDKFFNDMQLTPMNRLERMAGWNPDSRWYGMAKMLEKGERAQRKFKTEATRQIAPVLEQYKDWMKTADGQGKDGKWYEIEVPASWEYHMGDKPVFSNETVKVYMTPAQKVHMYLESKNYDNLRHMEGGRTFANKELYSKGKRAEAFAQGTTVKLLPETVKQIVSDLTEEEQALANALEKFYNGYSKDEINRVSNILYGYDKAMEGSYAPIYTNNNYTKSEPGIFDMTAEGVGNLKSRVVSANPSLNLSAFDAFEKSVDKTGKFVGLAIPIRNMNTLLNWREQGNSMKDVLDHKWGETSTKWVEDLLTELQSGKDANRSSIEELTNKALSKYISAVFGANPSIVAKQFASYPLAAAYLGWENMPVNIIGAAQVDTDLMAKYTGELDYRQLGYATPETATIKDNPGRLQEKGPLNFLLGGGAITWMDGFTVRTLWSWAENKVQKEQPDLEIGSQEQIDAGQSPYYKAVAAEFEEAVSRSQPMYDTMHRSNIMRESNPITRAFTLFKTVPQQEYNMLRQAVGEAEYYKRTGADKETQTAARQKAGRAFAGVLAGNLMIGAITFLNALWKNRGKKYRDEDGNLTLESVMKAAGKQYFKDSVGLTIGGSEAADVLSSILFGDKWYGLEMPGMEQIGSITEDVISATKTLKNLVQDSIEVLQTGGDWGQYMADHSETYLKAVDQVASTLGTYGTGLPIDNVKAYLLGAVQWISPEIKTAYEDLMKEADKSGLKGLTGASLEMRITHILQDRAGSADESTVEELARMYEAGYTDAIPAAQQTKLSVNGEERSLNLAQQQTYKNVWSDTVSGALDELVASDAYQAADDETRKKMLKKLYDLATAEAKDVLFDDFEDSSLKKVQEMQALGMSMADYAGTVAEYNAIGDRDDLSSYQRGVMQRDLIDSLRYGDKVKIQMYAKLNPTATSRNESFESLNKLGMSFGEITRAYDKHEELKAGSLSTNEQGNEFARWVDTQDWTARQKEQVKESFKFWQQIPANTDRYDKLTGEGLDANNAAAVNKAVTALGSDPSDTDKWQAAIKTVNGEDNQQKAVKALMTETQREKFQTAIDAGISTSVYVQYKVGTKDIKGDDKKKNVVAYIDSLDLTKEQKDILLTDYNKQYSHKDVTWHNGSYGGGKASGSYAPARIPTLRVPEIPKVEKPSSGLRIRGTQPSTAPRSGLRIRAK